MRTTQLSTAAAGGEAAAGMEEDALVVDDALSLLAAQASTSLLPLATSWPPASCSLSLLAAQGEVFLSAGVAYLDPGYVAALMKPLVDHKLSSRGHALCFA